MQKGSILGAYDVDDYGWIITRDHLAEKYPDMASAVGVVGPSSIPDGMESDLNAGKGVTFRMYDDDGELYFTGRFVGDHESESGFGPLDDYGKPDSGATEIRYQDNVTGKWRAL